MKRLLLAAIAVLASGVSLAGDGLPIEAFPDYSGFRDVMIESGWTPPPQEPSIHVSKVYPEVVCPGHPGEGCYAYWRSPSGRETITVELFKVYIDEPTPPGKPEFVLWPGVAFNQ